MGVFTLGPLCFSINALRNACAVYLDAHYTSNAYACISFVT